jgi:hypothetical protein
MVKYHFFAFAAALPLASLAAAQSVVNSSSTDINGNRVNGSTFVTAGNQTTEVSRSINGRQVPLEQSSSKVLSDDANGKVVETTIRKFDQNGQLTSTEKVVTEEQKRGTGSSVRSTTYRSDINGNMAQAERKIVQSNPQGPVVNTQTVVERPSINGSFETVEKRTLVSQAVGDTTHDDETVYRRSENGDFYPAVREITDTSHAGNQTTAKTTEYQQAGNSQMQVTRQFVSTTTKRADGSEVEEVNIYGQAVPGNVRESSAAPQLFEQQIIDRKKAGGDAVVETLSVRRPTMSDPKTLGPVQKISETTCKGKCTPDQK